MARRKSEPLVKSLRIDAAVVREQLDQFTSLGAGLATAHCTSCSPMPRLRQREATRTSSIMPREAPCELSPGRMHSCRQPTTVPSACSATTSWIWEALRGCRTQRNRTAAADLPVVLLRRLELLLDHPRGFCRTVADLLAELDRVASEAEKRHGGWPKAPNKLSGVSGGSPPICSRPASNTWSFRGRGGRSPGSPPARSRSASPGGGRGGAVPAVTIVVTIPVSIEGDRNRYRHQGEDGRGRRNPFPHGKNEHAKPKNRFLVSMVSIELDLYLLVFQRKRKGCKEKTWRTEKAKMYRHHRHQPTAFSLRVLVLPMRRQPVLVVPVVMKTAAS